MSADCSEGLTVHYSNWPPYHYADENQQATGLDVEILQHVFREIGCKYEMQFTPWKRALYGLQHGGLDVGLAASISAERQEYAWFSEPYRSEQMVMFMRKGEEQRFSPRSLSELALTDYNVGLILGIWYGEDLEKVFVKYPNFRSRVLQQLEHKSVFDRLLRGRVDVVVSDLFNGIYSAQKTNSLNELQIRPEIINDNEIHFMFSKKSVPYTDVERINAGIMAFRKSKAYTDLLFKYVPEEYRGMLPQTQ